MHDLRVGVELDKDVDVVLRELTKQQTLRLEVDIHHTIIPHPRHAVPASSARQGPIIRQAYVASASTDGGLGSGPRVRSRSVHPADRNPDQHGQPCERTR
jgi:hypothetical protein